MVLEQYGGLMLHGLLVVDEEEEEEVGRRDFLRKEDLPGDF